MKKSEAISLLGGTVTRAAEAMWITNSAVSKWPDDLSPRIAARVHEAIYIINKERAMGRRFRNAKCPIIEKYKKLFGYKL